MDYKEIKKKKTGEVLIFCDFEELIQEVTGLGIEEFKATTRKSGKEYLTDCPFCKAEGYRKKKLYIKEDFDLGFCQHCRRSFIAISDELRIEVRIPDFFAAWNQNNNIVLPVLSDERWNLDNWMYDFDDSDEVGEKYLAGRHMYLPEIAKLLEFKYNNGNVVIPFRYKGEVAYYQIRFSGKSKIKYFFPPTQGSNKMPYILDFGEGKRRLVVCEGVFDAIALMIMAPDYVPIAVLGSTITNYQMNYLREYLPEEIVVYMDKTELSKQVARKIKATIDYCPIRVIPSDGQDPEENLKNRIKYGKKLAWIYPKEPQPLKYKIPTSLYDNDRI